MAEEDKDIFKRPENKISNYSSSEKSNKQTFFASTLRVNKMALKMLKDSGRNKLRWFIGLGWPALFIVLLFVIMIPAIKTAVTLGDDAQGLFNLTKSDLSFVETVDPQILSEIKQSGGEEMVYAAFDCSNLSPAERRPGYNCIEGLLSSFEGQGLSPVPQRANYLVPVWKAAAKKYQLPWQLLAAVNGTRTNFGEFNCQDQLSGSGFYRLNNSVFKKYGVDAGVTPLEKSGLNCYSVDKQVIDNGMQPVINKTPKNKKRKPTVKTTVNINYQPLSQAALQTSKTDKTANPYDPVDAIFTDASMLARNGAFKTKDWNYSGSPSDQCTTASSDGRIWYLPQTGLAGFGAGAKLGYNKNLKIPRSIVELAAKYRSNTGKYKPRRDGSNEDDRLGRHPIPKKDLIKMLTAAWSAFGVRGQELQQNVTLNYAQIGRESGGRPYILQGFIGDVNDTNPAGGLMQFIKSTFNHWKVDGFNDRFNPIDNILATVNAQVNGPYPILNGSSGWSPPFSNNPYATGGRAEVVNDSTLAKGKGKALPRYPYKGKPQTDRVSKAVAFNGAGTNSDCYVAVVNDWYQAIKKYPPQDQVTGPLRQRIVAIAQAELKKNVSETGGDNVPRYRPSGKIAPYNIGAAWCQSFAAHVWYWAGIKQVNKLGGMVATDGLTVPSYTGAMTAAAQGNKLYGTYKTSNPLPGDMIFWSDSHVEIVEKVRNGKVVSTIGGNSGDAVVRNLNRSGTHYVSPPAQYGPSTYKQKLSLNNSSKSMKQATKQFQNLENKNKAEITLVAMKINSDNTDTQSYGKRIFSPAWQSLNLPIAVAVVREKNKIAKSSSLEKLLSNALHNPTKTTVSALYRRLGSKYSAKKKLESVLIKGGDYTTKINQKNYLLSNWSSLESSRFYKSFNNQQILNKQQTNYLKQLINKKPIKPKTGIKQVFTTSNYTTGEGTTNKKYYLRQSGLITVSNKQYSLSVNVKVNQNNKKAAKQALTNSLNWIKERL
jgi:hypothetical protein